MSAKLKYILAWGYLFLIVAAVVGAFLYNFSFGRRVVASFLQSETSIGYWIDRGHSPTWATATATAIGDFADANWWLLIFYVIDAWRLAHLGIEKLQNLIPSSDSNRFVEMVKRWGIWAVPLFCAAPIGGSVWVSYIGAKLFRLHPGKVLVGALIGNTVKGAIWGTFFGSLLLAHLPSGSFGLVSMGASLLMSFAVIVATVRRFGARKKTTTAPVVTL